MNNEHRTLRYLHAELARVEADRDRLLALLERTVDRLGPSHHWYLGSEVGAALKEIETGLAGRSKPARGVYPCGDPELDGLALRPEGSVSHAE